MHTVAENNEGHTSEGRGQDIEPRNAEGCEKPQKVDLKMVSRAYRWTASTKCRVSHPKHGSVIVPHRSKLAALENAAEFWRCDWMDLSKEATVMAVGKDEGPVRRPREFCGNALRNQG